MFEYLQLDYKKQHCKYYFVCLNKFPIYSFIHFLKDAFRKLQIYVVFDKFFHFITLCSYFSCFFINLLSIIFAISHSFSIFVRGFSLQQFSCNILNIWNKLKTNLIKLKEQQDLFLLPNLKKVLKFFKLVNKKALFVKFEQICLVMSDNQALFQPL